jgi:hypothetical protein
MSRGYKIYLITSFLFQTPKSLSLKQPKSPHLPEMAALRFCLLACLLLAAIAPLASSRANLEENQPEDVEEPAENGDAEVRKKRSPGLYHCGGENEPSCSAPRTTCRTVWEEKTTPKCHTTYDQVSSSVLFPLVLIVLSPGVHRRVPDQVPHRAQGRVQGRACRVVPDLEQTRVHHRLHHRL